jgi:hypothetical protein
MVDGLLGPLGKLAAPLLQRLLLEPRVALRVKSELAREHGVKVHYRTVLGALRSGEALRSFRTHGPKSANARLALSPFFDAVRGPEITDDRAIEIVYAAYVQLSGPSVAVDLSGRRTDALAQRSSTEVIQQVSESGAEILHAIKSSQADAATFRYNLRGLPRVLAEEAAALQPRWPAVARAVASIAESDDPKALITTWSEDRFAPVRDATPRALAWLGELAEALGAPDVAAVYYSKSIEDGVSPSGYWRVREVQCRSSWSSAESISYLERSTHPWASAALAQLRDEPDSSDSWLDAWEPISASERAQRDLVRVRIAAARGDWASAEAGGRELFEASDLINAGLIAVEAVLSQEHQSGERGNTTGLADALQLALKIRDRCRELRLPSGEAASRAIYVSRVLGDTDRALRLGLAVPEGEALGTEARSEPVLLELAEQSARAAQPERTLLLLRDVKNESRKNDVLGALEEALGHEQAAVVRWHLALSMETDVRRQAMMLWHLAIRGLTHPAGVEIAQRDPELGQDLSLSARLVRDPEAAIPEARAAALTNRRLAFGLLEFFSRTKRTSDEEQLALAAAERFDDADLWVTSARLALEDGRANDATVRADKALASAPDEWGGTARALLVKMNSAAQLDDWDAAARAAELLNRSTTDNQSVAWAVSVTRFRAGDYRKSLDAWIEAGRPDPIERDHAVVWLELRRRIGPEVGDINDAVRFAAMWPEDEALRAALIVTFVGEDLPDEQVEAYRSAFTAYWDDFPEGGTIRRVDLDTDRLLESMNEILGPAPDFRDLFLRIVTGGIPLGMMASLRHRTYSEILVGWGSAARQSVRNEPADQQAVQNAKVRGAVIDLSALFSLSAIDRALAATLFGSLPMATVTSTQFRDAVEGEYAIRTQTGLSMSPVGEGGQYVPVSTPDRDLLVAKGRAERMVEWVKASTRVTVTEIRSLPELASSDLKNESWLTALDHAIRANRPLWSDDATLRTIARSRGIQAFSTGALIADQIDTGALDRRVADIGLAQLHSAGYVDVPYSERSFALALQLDSNLPRGTAQALRFSRSMHTAEIGSRLVAIFDAIASVAHDPSAVASWIFVLADWMIRITDDESAAERNVGLVLGAALRTPWLSASTFPFVLNGVTSALGEHLLADSCVIETVTQRYQVEVHATEPAVAFAWINGLCTSIDPSLRQRIIERIFTTV